MPPTYREIAPAAALADWVECFWHLESNEPVARHPVPPDGCLDIIYTPGEGLRAVGAMTVEQSFAFPAPMYSVGVRFQPGMAGSFMRVAPGELTDRIVPLADMWGRQGAALARRMNDASTGRAALGILMNAMAAPADAANAVQRAIAALVSAGGLADLEWLARQANLSPRQFRRRCLEESGLTPKFMARVLRFRRASQMAEQATRHGWAGIACEAGYFDQAHLIRDFREFTGRTPMTVFSNPTVAAPG